MLTGVVVKIDLGPRQRAAGATLTMLAEAVMLEAFEHGGKLVGIFTIMGFLLTAMLSSRE